MVAQTTCRDPLMRTGQKHAAVMLKRFAPLQATAFNPAYHDLRSFIIIHLLMSTLRGGMETRTAVS